ncbi:FG-GAP repeat domain-containing protein [Tichowtungia aerotolerans]|uniref:VCBS repeat-containing protein n=1 Tax=Tichowtungia aerotolerans TaxID=2697043 RepID=A0A6P1MCU5_9BACT|nr:VCBS repeat-containing protein [Tichowtungia aerotolerans]QHI68915.1 hypothetical protein GT409_05450 [Tichowtungia aerotolerans]
MPLSATLYMYEPFSDSAESLTKLPGWKPRSKGSNIPARIAPGKSLKKEGLPESQGGYLLLGNQESNQKAYDLMRRIEGDVYYSFLMEIDEADLPEKSSLIISLYGKKTNSRFIIAPSPGGYKAGIGHSSKSVYASDLLLPGQTVLVVVKLDFDPKLQNHRLSLYLNPDPSGDEPALSSISQEGGTEPYIELIIFRQIDQSGTTKIDELRVASTWAGAVGREALAGIPTGIYTSENMADRRLAYNNPDVTPYLGVGLWSIPFPMDYDNDGDYDLVIGCGDKPYRGTYLFKNNGSGVMEKAVQLSSDAHANMAHSETPNGTFITRPDKQKCKVWTDFTRATSSPYKTIPFEQDFYSGRQSTWRFADYDGDGDTDLYFGADDWREYGWDDSFNEEGEWTAGRLHGFVYWSENTGTDEAPKYSASQKIEPIDTYGYPQPCLVDWDGDGDLDFICGEFLDKITFFENIGTRTEPRYAEGRFLTVNGETLHLELEMLLLSSVDWDHDGDPDLIVGKEDGRVVYIENIGGGNIAEPVYFRQQADRVKSGALVTPDCIDWDQDGDLDIVTGNTAGFVEFIENLGGLAPDTKWAEPVRLKADGKTIRVMAGENGSIQGPAEAKWGYTVVGTADWNQDGLPDLMLNSIIGKIIWYKNIGTPGNPVLTGPLDVDVKWPEGETPPKPAWNWWNPEDSELAVEWRTRPDLVDIDEDGRIDLVTLDHEGYLAWYQRRADGMVNPGKRIFKMAPGEDCVLDNNAAPMKFDVNKDGINDLTQKTADGETLYMARTHTYSGSRRNYVKSPTRSFEEETFPAGDNTGQLLRANGGWAGRSGRCKYRLTDWDGDGDLDLLVNSKSIDFLENIGSNTDFIFVSRGKIVGDVLAGHTTCPAVIDLTGEGIPDLLIGAEDGYFYHYPRTSYEDMLGTKE